jgi:hypothetical protein
MKKAQSLSMNTIIIAALALLVLIIIALIFTGRIKLTREGIDACASNGGSCIEKTATACTGTNDKTLGYVCLGSDKKPDPNQICCLTV